MAVPEGTKQITMFVDAELLKVVDEAARSEFNVNNGRTKWIVKAMRERLDNAPEDERLLEVGSIFEGLSEDGRKWLYDAALMARDADLF